MKKKNILHLCLLILLLLILSVTGCMDRQQPGAEPDSSQGGIQKQEPQPKEEPKPKGEPAALAVYFPASLGSAWDYQGEGNEYASFTRKVVFTRGNRAQFREDTGGTVGASVFEITGSTITRVYFLGEAYEGKNLLNQPPNDSMVILKTPIEVGTNWKQRDGSTREIVEVNAKVITPAGAFSNTVKVKIAGKDSTIYEYYQKGVGLVKREFISGEARVTSSLKEYEIK